MTIAVGQKIPSVTLRTPGPDGVAEVKTDDLFRGKKAVLFGVPGAFTPTCSNQHLPGYVEHADAFKAKGVSLVACVAVNDAQVLGAWGKKQSADGKVMMLADGNGDLARALGLDVDLRAAGLGTRCKRFAMIVDDGVVKDVQVEQTPRVCGISGAPDVLSRL